MGFIIKDKKISLGFTLVEIMIVVTIITLLAAIAIPSFLRTRHNANETVAVASSRAISTGCQNFYANSTPHRYPQGLLELASPQSNPAYIDSVLAGGTKQGYSFTYVSEDSESFVLNADPIYSGRSGTRHFYVDETGVIRANSLTRAGPNDPPIQ